VGLLEFFQKRLMKLFNICIINMLNEEGHISLIRRLDSVRSHFEQVSFADTSVPLLHSLIVIERGTLSTSVRHFSYINNHSFPHLKISNFISTIIGFRIDRKSLRALRRCAMGIYEQIFCPVHRIGIRARLGEFIIFESIGKPLHVRNR
jgi:hypothetical protein